MKFLSFFLKRNMKKIAALCLTAFLGIGIFSCKKTKEKINSLTEFDMSYSTTFTLPATGVIVNTPVDFTTPDVETNSESIFASQKTLADKVTEINLKKLSVSTDTGNFDYLKSITIFIQAPNQPEAQIATRANVPTGVTSFDLDLSDVNIKNYISGKTFKLRINAVADGAVTSDQQIKLDETMRVKASLL
jgi:hypothetical protein